MLAGGRSSRFGSDKASARLHGKTFLEHVVGACLEVAQRVVVVLSPEQPLPALGHTGIRFARDATPHEGPLAGVLAGLAAVGDGWAIACSCDAPFVQASVLALLAVRRSDAIRAVLPEFDGRLQPFPSAIAVSALPVLQAQFAAGERRIGRALEQLPHAVLPQAELRAADPRFLGFRNVNTPSDLARLESETSIPKTERPAEG